MPRMSVQWLPTGNHGGPMAEHRGAVLHIAEGTYAGTIAWCRNPASEVSAHFVTSRGGDVTQLVDTSVQSWCQAAGNPRWLSIENEGWSGEELTGAQVDACARILAWCHQVHGVPLQVADSPSGRGLGTHAMGGAAWGGHTQCPGTRIAAQRKLIIDRARGLVEADMQQTDRLIAETGHGGRTVADHFGDLQRLRGWLIGEGGKSADVPPAGSPLARILAAADRPQAQVVMSAADRETIVRDVTTQVLAGVEDRLRSVLGSLDGR